MQQKSMRNVTVTLQEDVARWARIEAARRETSVSRFLGDILKERMLRTDEYERSMQLALAGKPLFTSDGNYLPRDQVHERNRLR